MKYLLLLMLISIKTSAQEKLYDYSFELNCENISNGLIDNQLYELINGRVFVKEDYDKSKMYKIIIENGKTYYVSIKLKKIIRKIIRKKKCYKIKIEKPLSIKDDKAPKIVRD